MKLCSLLYCADDETARLISRVFKDLGVDVERVPSADSVAKRLTQEHLDAVVVDDSDPAGAMLVLETARSLPASKKCFGVVLADPQTSLMVAFGAGTDVVIYRPIALDRLRSALRAVRNLMGRRHRKSPRVPVKIPVKLYGKNKTETSGLIVNLSESGAALLVKNILGVSIEPRLTVRWGFTGSKNSVIAQSEIVWQDAEGRIGIWFVEMSSASQRALRKWLQSTHADVDR